MPIQGLQRFRKHQLGVQTSFSSNSAATVVLPYRGSVTINPNLEDPDVDVGSLDPVLAPFAGAAEYEGEWEGKLDYKHAPYLWSGILKGGIVPTGGGAAKTYTWQAASLTQDTFVYYTDQWGDDVLTDWVIGGSGVIDELTVGFDDDLGAWDVEASLLFARASFGGPTGGLSVTESLPWVYGADTEVFVDSAFGSIGTTKWTDAIHTLELEISANNDIKRFANGSNTRFQAAGIGRGQREITLTLGVAKTTETIAAVQTLDDAPPALSFIEIRTVSPEIITGSTPYSQTIRLPMRLVEAEPEEFGDNNTGWNLTYRGRYNSDLGYAIRVVVVTSTTATI
jgi:hypothetical protein